MESGGPERESIVEETQDCQTIPRGAEPKASSAKPKGSPSVVSCIGTWLARGAYHNQVECHTNYCFSHSGDVLLLLGCKVY